MKNLNAGQVAELVQGRLSGDPKAEVHGIAEIDEASGTDLVYAVSPRYVSKLKACASRVAIVPIGEWDLADKTLIQVEQPYYAIAHLLNYMDPRQQSQTGVSARAHVDASARIAQTVTVYSGAYVDADVDIGKGSVLYPGVVVLAGARIGEDCILHPGSVVRENCQLGNRCILQPNAVVGSDGFGFVEVQGEHFKIPQIGRVILQEDVEVGACSTLDRGTFRDTIIGKGSKLDNLVQIGHNVVTGNACLFAAQSGISGSTKLGDHVTFAGQSGSVGHIEIGSRTVVMARGVATQNLRGGQYISGFPGREHRLELKEKAALKKLPALRSLLMKVVRFLGLETD